MTLSEYSHLKQQIVFSVGSSDRHNNLLTTLKDLFRDEINSPRRFEAITKIGELLNVLEVRDVLSEDNVAPLKVIAQKLVNANELLAKITRYENTHVAREYRNYYDAVPNIGNRAYNMTIHSNNSTQPQGALSPVKRQRIIQAIVDEIGNSWRDLARCLNIRECDINDIDHNNKSLTRKAFRLMEIYFHKKADPNNWYFEICDALNKTRRKDLSKSIQKIVMMNV